MLSDAPNFYFRGPHLIVFPGILITVTVLCAYLIGDGLRDAFDPRLRGSIAGKVSTVGGVVVARRRWWRR
jgi:hypothetical protein